MTSRRVRAASMSSTSRLVTIRLKRRCDLASASACAPRATCVIPGTCEQIEFERLPDQQLIQAAVLAQDERVVEAGDEQNVLHAEGHQVLEALEEALGVDDGVGGVGQRHGSANS